MHGKWRCGRGTDRVSRFRCTAHSEPTKGIHLHMKRKKPSSKATRDSKRKGPQEDSVSGHNPPNTSASSASKRRPAGPSIAKVPLAELGTFLRRSGDLWEVLAFPEVERFLPKEYVSSDAVIRALSEHSPRSAH